MQRRNKIKDEGFGRSLMRLTHYGWVLFLFVSSAYCANQSDLEKLIAMKKTQITMHLDLSNADLRAYPFIPGKIDLQQANISHSNLSGTDLSRLNLGGADLSYTDLSNAKLNQVNLAGANLDHANLSGAEIQQSDLSRTNLSNANLTGANLQQSLLASANLTCANLNQANLSKTTFTQATIAGATFTNTITSDVIGYDSVLDSKVDCGA